MLQVQRLLYADSGAYKLVRSDKKKKNFVGFIAVEQGVPAGRGADVAVVWRGTITRDEWIQVRPVLRRSLHSVRLYGNMRLG